MAEETHDPNIDEKINPPERANPDEAHEGAKETQVSDRVGPGAGYDQEPETVTDTGGVVP